MQGAARAEAVIIKKSLRAAEQDHPDVAARGAEWRVSQLGLNPHKLVFVERRDVGQDEHEPPARPRPGRRAAGRAGPARALETTTLVAALGRRGVRCSTTVDGAVNREVFEAFVAQVLCPTLAPGDVVVLDNLSSHKGVRARELVEQRGATLVFLPPYSPDLDPIELAFAKLQAADAVRGHRTTGVVVRRAADARRGHAGRRRGVLTRDGV